MFIYAFIGILFEFPLYYFLVPAKDRKPQLILFIVLINFISWPLSFAIGKTFPIPIVNFLVFTLFGALEGVALHFAYSQNIPLKKAVLYGAGISLASFIFIRLLVS
jgi:hypothetical protein